MTKSWFCYWIVIIYVILVYAFYPAFHLSFTAVPQTLYQYLTQGFLSGHLNLSIPPSAELLNLANPYDPIQNAELRLHDASLYQGKYYLYFGPLPVLAFYIPFKWLIGFYPSDALAVFFFLTVGFIVNSLLIIKIRDKYFPKVSESQSILILFLMGFANGTPLLLSVPRVYEAAIASAFCFMSLSLFFLYQALNKQYKTKYVFLFSLFLSLTVAGRPHFALVCIVLISAFLIHLFSHAPRNQRVAQVIALLVPSVSIALILGLYNYLRFGSIFDFGHVWQLSCNNIKDLHRELSDLTKIPRNVIFSFYYYFLQPFTISLNFPYFGLRMHDCWHHIDKDYYLESIAGVLTTIPFIVLILALPKLISLYFRKKTAEIPLLWFLIFTLFIPLINALFLLLLPFAIQRYEVDFVPYLVLLSIITLWMLEDYLAQTIGGKLIKFIFSITALFSILLGLAFGLAYWVFR